MPLRTLAVTIDYYITFCWCLCSGSVHVPFLIRPSGVNTAIYV